MAQGVDGGTATGSLGFEISMQNYDKKKRPAKLGLIYAEDCSKLQSIAEKCVAKCRLFVPLIAMQLRGLGGQNLGC